MEQIINYFDRLNKKSFDLNNFRKVVEDAGYAFCYSKSSNTKKIVYTISINHKAVAHLVITSEWPEYGTEIPCLSLDNGHYCNCLVI